MKSPIAKPVKLKKAKIGMVFKERTSISPKAAVLDQATKHSLDQPLPFCLIVSWFMAKL
jgi:hypothetical protein